MEKARQEPSPKQRGKQNGHEHQTNPRPATDNHNKQLQMERPPNPQPNGQNRQNSTKTLNHWDMPNYAFATKNKSKRRKQQVLPEGHLKCKLQIHELQELFRIHAGKKLGGFQLFLNKLANRVTNSCHIILTPEDIQRISRYCHYTKHGGFQSRLRKIFRRNLIRQLGKTATATLL